MHPREHRLTRRNLMRGALGAGAAMGVAGATAGCAEHDDRDRLGRGRRAPPPCAKLVVPQAHRAGRPAAAAPRLQRHLGDHRRQPADQGRPEARGRHAPGLQLRRLHLARPRQEVREAVRLQGQDRDLQLRRRGDREALVGQRRLRRRDRPERQQHGDADRAAADDAAQRTTTCRTSRRTSGRRCRIRSTTAARATRSPTSCGRTASAGATTRSARTSPA